MIGAAQGDVAHTLNAVGLAEHFPDLLVGLIADLEQFSPLAGDRTPSW